MKGEKFLRIVVIVLLCAVASYVVLSVLHAPGTEYTTYKAARYEVGDGITTSGFVVRTEYVLPGAHGSIVQLKRTEGERVGAKQEVAATFQSQEAMERQNRIDELKSEIDQLKITLADSGSGVDTVSLDDSILSAIGKITLCSAHRDYAVAGNAAEQLKTDVLRRYLTSEDAASIQARIDEAQAQLETMEQERLRDDEIGSIRASKPGFFSASVDGYEEELTPDFIRTATVSEFSRYKELEKRSLRAVGKIVTSPKWYYVAIISNADAGNLREGKQVTVRFSRDFQEDVQMKVDRISNSEKGKCLLVLSSEKFIQDAVTSRAQTAQLILETISGLQVPKTAIYVNGAGQSGVYILECAQARWKTVDILYDNGDSFLVRLDQTSTANLWPEDEIILTSDELFEGKVMDK